MIQSVNEKWVIAAAISHHSFFFNSFIKKIKLIYFIHGNGMQWNGKGVNVVKLINRSTSIPFRKWELRMNGMKLTPSWSELLNSIWDNRAAGKPRNVIEERNECNEWIEAINGVNACAAAAAGAPSFNSSFQSSLNFFTLAAWAQLNLNAFLHSREEWRECN